MRVDFRDENVIHRISPAALLAYAESEGWQRSDEYGEYSLVYSSFEHPEILLPHTQEIADYAGVVNRIIKIFASASGLNEIEVYESLLVADRDTIRVHATDDRLTGGVSLFHGARLIDGFYRMVSAAARSFLEPQALHHKRPSGAARRYLNQLRLGKAETGSLVLTVHTAPIPPSTTDHGDSNLDRITSYFNDALAITRSATESARLYDDFVDFEDLIRRGMSANLCDALIQLIEPISAFETRVIWARTRQHKDVGSTIRFTHSDLPALGQAASTLRSSRVTKGIDILARVDGLQRHDPRHLGTVILRGNVEGRLRTVRARFTPNDYDLAIRAHHEDQYIHVRGDMVELGYQHYLRGAHIPASKMFDSD